MLNKSVSEEGIMTIFSRLFFFLFLYYETWEFIKSCNWAVALDSSFVPSYESWEIELQFPDILSKVPIIGCMVVSSCVLGTRVLEVML
jgi:hypothetical protein